jgi:hypothetical protein
MSSFLLSLGLWWHALRIRAPYLHSPVDDLESFYYTAQWAAAFNDGASGRKYDGGGIKRFRSMIASDEREGATLMVERELTHTTNREAAEYGAFFTSSLALLSPWVKKLSSLRIDWRAVMYQVQDLDDKDREKHLHPSFLIYGYRGVKEYFELVHEHRASLQGIV